MIDLYFVGDVKSKFRTEMLRTVFKHNLFFDIQKTKNKLAATIASTYYIKRAICFLKLVKLELSEV